MGLWRSLRPEVSLSKRFLIVDDNDQMRKLLRQLLEHQEGWEVSGEASNGRDAIEQTRQLKPDLVVLDISMPVMNGLDAARELKSLFPSIPLLMFTSFDTPQLKKITKEAGVDAVVRKSEPTSLIPVIQSLLETSRKRLFNSPAASVTEG